MSSARNQRLAPQYTGDTARDAALRGASLAFSKPPEKAKPQVNTYTGGDNGALLAATRVGTPVKRDWTGGSSRPSLSPMQTASKSNSSNSLGVPDDHFDRVPSPSNIAARLAAARHSPLRPRPQPAVPHTMSEREPNERDILPPSGSVGNVLARLESKKHAQQVRRRGDSLGSTSSTFRPAGGQHRPTDDSPIPPTTSLVKMFEQNQSEGRAKSPAIPLNIAQHSPPPVRSPKPQRTFKLPPEPADGAVLRKARTHTPPPVKPKPNHQIEISQPHFTDGAKDQAYFNTYRQGPLKSPPIKQKPAKLTALKTATPPPMPPPQRGSRPARPGSHELARVETAHRRLSTSIDSYKTPSSPASSFKSAKEEQEVEEKPKPSLPPPRRSGTRKTTSVPANVARRPTAPIQIPNERNRSQNPSVMRAPERLSPTHRPKSAMGSGSPSVYHNTYQRESVKEITKHMTGESLSSAIMGAALAASSRNVSPAPRPMSIEPLFPPRKQHHHHLPFHRSPSPPKQSPPKSAGKMRTTMRKDPSSSEDEDEVEKYKKKGTRIMGIKGRKHPNKHHEGTRKRWRDQITERERKRYEGVWAANKGLLLPPASDADDDPSVDVLNLAVRELWTRSRLPVYDLEEVWDLVDSRGIGRLTRYEFVVGLWLIDQRLKGRKLPQKVSDSVWQSARGIGIKVKIHR